LLNQHLPQQSTLPKELRVKFPTCKAKQETASKANIIGIGKVVSLKDLSNIHQKQKLNSGINSLEGTVKLLKCTYGGVHGNDVSWL